MGNIGAATYDAFMAPLEGLGLARLRRKVLRGLGGRVLEIGIGTGLTLPHYDGHDLEIVGVDPDASKLRRAARRAETLAIAPQFHALDGAPLPFAGESFDAIVLSLVLCTVPEPAATLAEALSLLRPGGELRAIEHVIAPGRVVAAMQHGITPAWKHVAGGCHLDRDSVGAIRDAGFAIEAIRPHLGGIFVEIYARRPTSEASDSTT